MLVTNYYQSNVITCPGFTRFKTQITRNEFTLKRSLNAAGGGGGTPYNGLYREDPPERGTFFRFQVYERVGISLVEAYERVGKSFGPKG